MDPQGTWPGSQDYSGKHIGESTRRKTVANAQIRADPPIIMRKVCPWNVSSYAFGAGAEVDTSDVDRIADAVAERVLAALRAPPPASPSLASRLVFSPLRALAGLAARLLWWRRRAAAGGAEDEKGAPAEPAKPWEPLAENDRPPIPGDHGYWTFLDLVPTALAPTELADPSWSKLNVSGFECELVDYLKSPTGGGVETEVAGETTGEATGEAAGETGSEYEYSDNSGETSDEGEN